MDLTTGNVHQKLARFAGPVIIFALFNQLYVIADSVIVARFAGEQALSVIASTAAVISVANCLINGRDGSSGDGGHSANSRKSS